MFVYEKKLQYPVNIKTTNPKLAKIIITQYGGPDGELGASLRYLSQRFTMPMPELKGTLTDIRTDQLVIHLSDSQQNPTILDPTPAPSRTEFAPPLP
ncbi:MAG: manganese catalase family protein, partial [Ruminococcus sp.]|nr:manganese catalase family protein [Ruminococcus sp.]